MNYVPGESVLGNRQLSVVTWKVSNESELLNCEVIESRSWERGLCGQNAIVCGQDVQINVRSVCELGCFLSSVKMKEREWLVSKSFYTSYMMNGHRNLSNP